MAPSLPRAADFDRIACQIIGVHRYGKALKRSFAANFGVSSDVCAVAWETLYTKGNISASAHPKHLLWALHFLKTYATENASRAILKADECTIRKWRWHFVELLAELKTVSRRQMSINIYSAVVYFYIDCMVEQIRP